MRSGVSPLAMIFSMSERIFDLVGFFSVEKANTRTPSDTRPRKAESLMSDFSRYDLKVSRSRPWSPPAVPASGDWPGGGHDVGADPGLGHLLAQALEGVVLIPC